eukprot:scpid96573/ scgid14856/ 
MCSLLVLPSIGLYQYHLYEYLTLKLLTTIQHYRRALSKNTKKITYPNTSVQTASTSCMASSVAHNLTLPMETFFFCCYDVSRDLQGLIVPLGQLERRTISFPCRASTNAIMRSGRLNGIIQT